MKLCAQTGEGISRSAAVVAAVLMQSENLTADAAMSAVKRARQWASPNAGFQAEPPLVDEAKVLALAQ